MDKKSRGNYYVGGGNEIQEKPGLLALPDVVTRHICRQFLDVNTLTTLRLTCQDLKDVVEQATVLERLPVKIPRAKQLQKVLESNVLFNNFVLGVKSLEEQSRLVEFSEKRGAFMKKLKITTCLTNAGHEKAVGLLTKCPSLKELDMRSWNTTIYQKNQELLKIILKNLQEVRKFSIHEFEEGIAKGIETIDFFLQVLNNCKKLEELIIPAINSYNQKLLSRQLTPPVRVEEHQAPVNNPAEENWEPDPSWQEDRSDPDPIPEWDAQDKRDLLIHPILKYIEMRAKLKHPNLKLINVRNISVFEGNTFKDLLLACKGNGIRITGIQSIQLAHIKSEIWPLNPNPNSVIKSAHFNGVRETLPISIFEDVTDLTVSIIRGCYGFAKDADFSFCQLENLHVKFLADVSDEKSQLCIRRLFKDYQRSSVKTLKVEWLLHENCQTITSRDLVVNFGYLREIEIAEWNAYDEDFRIIWESMPDLEKITITDCKKITNKAFVGNFDMSDKRNISQRPLNRLKKLKSLRIRDHTGNVNEVAFMGSFRWLKLQTFEFESTVIHTLPVEIYKSLMLAPFGKTVEYFVAPKPKSRSFIFDERAFMSGFKNLKQRVFW